MRQIKFRAWDKENKKWLDGSDFLVTHDGLVLLYSIEEGRKLPNLIGKWREDEEENIELVRFTGLKDKNGKEIYEGDILDGFLDNQMGSYSPKRCSVFWNQNRAEFACEIPNEEDICWSIGTNSIVIGNIYENPELLT